MLRSAGLWRGRRGQDAWHPELTITFDAIHWQPAIIRGLPCVSIIMWQHPTRPGLTPIPLGRTDWPIGFDTDYEPQDIPPQSLPSIIEDRQAGFETFFDVLDDGLQNPFDITGSACRL